VHGHHHAKCNSLVRVYSPIIHYAWWNLSEAMRYDMGWIQPCMCEVGLCKIVATVSLIAIPHYEWRSYVLMAISVCEFKLRTIFVRLNLAFLTHTVCAYRNCNMARVQAYISARCNQTSSQWRSAGKKGAKSWRKTGKKSAKNCWRPTERCCIQSSAWKHAPSCRAIGGSTLRI